MVVNGLFDTDAGLLVTNGTKGSEVLYRCQRFWLLGDFSLKVTVVQSGMDLCWMCR